jgi:riboflavin synthase
MFTGIIETMGEVVKTERSGTNTRILVKSAISDQLKVDQSVSHNGVCLTVTDVEGQTHWVTAVDETLRVSTLKNLRQGAAVNLERCMLSNGRFDGHIVQGHVDQIALVESIQDAEGSWLFELRYDPAYGNITVEKGSIAVDGVSLTCFNSTAEGFTVAIIPYTFHHTNFKNLRIGNGVNLEFDIIGKYVKKLLSSRS